MNINMRWKIVAQFLGAFLLIAIAGNIITSVVSSYFTVTKDIGIGTAKTIVSFSPKELDIKKLSLALNESGINALSDNSLIDMLKKSNSWIQILDNDGKEINSVLKPDFIQDSYTNDEISDLYRGSKEESDYTIFALPIISNAIPKSEKAKTDVIIESKINKLEVIPKSESSSVITVPAQKFISIIGVPKQKITAYNILYSIYDYLTQWANPKSMPKTISTVITLILVLFFGYIFAKGITKPVVKITNGISSIAGGDYSVQYAEKGLYKQVYGSLNGTVKALKAAELERRRVEQMREDWIANLSHDLKTPLSSIKGYGELLLEPGYELTGEERKKFSEIILNKTAYMEMLLDDLKLTQKLKNDLIPLNRLSGNLVELLREIVIDLLNDPKYTNRKVIFEPEEEQVHFQYDAILFQRALTNIVHNAVVHNPDDTLVQVGISTKEGICITVTDNGSGISEEDQKNLFERYYRGTNTEASASGSGLGLAIAKQVIEAHDGRIELESEIGKGTAVKILF